MICSKCELDKPEDNFSFRDRVNGIRRTQCKDCVKIYRKDYYYENREKAIKYSKLSNIEARERNRQYLWNYLQSHPCVDCGESDPIVLDFDHRDGVKKIDHVSKSVDRIWSIEKIQEEIDKCDVRCSNCHRRRTAKQYGWYKNIIV